MFSAEGDGEDNSSVPQHVVVEDGCSSDEEDEVYIYTSLTPPPPVFKLSLVSLHRDHFSS